MAEAVYAGAVELVAVAVKLNRPLGALTGEVTFSVTPVRMFEGSEILSDA